MIKFNKIFSIILISLICITKGNTEIKDALFAIVGNKAVTKSDIVNEIKTILILSNESYSNDKREQLNSMAVKSVIQRSIKENEIEKFDFLEFNPTDLNKELMRLANNLNIDLDTLKNICASNDLDFSLIENQIKTELLWNSLIFQIYKDEISINIDEIDEQLKLIQKKKYLEEYLISEIIILPVKKNELKSEIEKLKIKINEEGFENVAKSLSISNSAIKGGDLGWLNENVISKKYQSIIFNTPVGNLSDPIILPEGVLIFKVRDRRKIEKEINLEEVKDQIVNSEKSKILNMHSMSHFDKLRRTISLKFLDE